MDGHKRRRIYPMTSCHVCDELSVEDKTVFKGDQRLVTTSLWAEILARIHRTYIGIEGCLQIVHESLHRLRMNTDVKKVVRSVTCADLRKPLSRKKPSTHITYHRNHGQKFQSTSSNFTTIHILWQSTITATTGVTSHIYKLKQHFTRHTIPNTCLLGQWSLIRFKRISKVCPWMGIQSCYFRPWICIVKRYGGECNQDRKEVNQESPQGWNRSLTHAPWPAKHAHRRLEEPSSIMSDESSDKNTTPDERQAPQSTTCRCP